MSRLLTPGQLWLYRTKPRDDEIFSSWLVRLSWGCAIKLQTFCTKILSQPPGFLSHDIDRRISESVQKRLFDGVGVTFNRIEQTTLDAYEGILWDAPTDVSKRRRVPWAMPIVRSGRYRLGFGQQYCRLCLVEDEVPYFRRQWRLSLSVACVKHGVYLRDACPSCCGPVIFHTGDFNQKLLADECPIVVCGFCRHDLRLSHHAAELIVDSKLLDFQNKLNQALINGFEQTLPGARNYSLLFFSGLRQIVRLLLSNGRAARLRDHLLAELGSLPFAIGGRRGSGAVSGAVSGVIFEELRIGDRIKTLELANTLLVDWPAAFIDVCKTSRVSSSYLTDSKPWLLPYWFSNCVREYLYDQDYAPTLEERQSVINYLHKNGANVNENEVRRLLGLSFTKLTAMNPPKSHRWNPRGPTNRYPEHR